MAPRFAFLILSSCVATDPPRERLAATTVAGYVASKRDDGSPCGANSCCACGDGSNDANWKRWNRCSACSVRLALQASLPALLRVVPLQKSSSLAFSQP